MKVAIILIGLISLSAGLQLTCLFTIHNWPTSYIQTRSYKTCDVKNQAVDSPEATIEPFSKDEATAIWILGNKQVKHVPSNLAALPHLFAIEIASCGISSVGDQFKGLPELVYLKLQSNQIEEIQNNAFVDNVKLELLGLYNNKLKSVNSELFNMLINLQELFLRGNQIESIDSSVFVNLINVEILDLQSNKLTFIGAKTFDSLKNLKRVDLTNNICFSKNYDSSTLNTLRNDVLTNCKSQEVSTSEENFKLEWKNEISNLNSNLTDFIEKSIAIAVLEINKSFKAEIGEGLALKSEQGRCDCNEKILELRQKNLELNQKFEMVNANLKEEQLKVAELNKNFTELQERQDACITSF